MLEKSRNRTSQLAEIRTAAEDIMATIQEAAKWQRVKNLVVCLHTGSPNLFQYIVTINLVVTVDCTVELV